MELQIGLVQRVELLVLKGQLVPKGRLELKVQQDYKVIQVTQVSLVVMEIREM
jgi:hypothetical protein